MNTTTISVIGMGKLGLPTMTFFASRGCKAIGVDTNKALIADLARGIADSEEPGLASHYADCRDHITVTGSVEEAVKASDITFVIVPTPSLPSGEFSTELVKAAAQEIGRALRDKNTWHLCVLVSTVMPGATEESFIRIIEEYSGQWCVGPTAGKNCFGVCYNPEFIALGSIFKNLSKPDFILVGESDAESGCYLERFYQRIFSSALAYPTVRRMSIKNAELTKIGINTYVTMKISLANTFAEFCEHMEGLDAEAVLGAMGLDSRIGSKYLKPGLGYGGPCFPRDTRALEAFARSVGVTAYLAQATNKINRQQAARLVRRIIRKSIILQIGENRPSVSVLGLSYKTDTDVIEESQSMEIIDRILRSDFRTKVTVHDRPKTLTAAKKILGDSVTYAKNIDTALSGADIIVIGVSDKTFVQKIECLPRRESPRLIVDPWRLLKSVTLPSGTAYLTVGK